MFEQASKLTGIKEKTQLLHEGLKTLIAKESAKRLSMLGGAAPNIQDIPRRKSFLSLIESLPQGKQATNDEVTHLIESHKLHGKGIGFTDAHILASSMIDEVPLWTKDKRLHSISKKICAHRM